MALVLALRSILSRRSKPFKSLSQVGRTVDSDETGFDQFDFIIVGGGTSGCVLAARLSEDPSIRVLLLESGTSGKTLQDSVIPSAYGRLFRTKHTFNLYTEPQVYTTGKRNYWPRGRMLGGCSSINAQMAQFGAPADFDQWAETIQDESWSWKNFNKYFKKFETYVPHNDYPQVDQTAHGHDGPVCIGYFNTVTEASQAFIDSCINNGIPFTHDFDGPSGTMGVSRIMTYIDEKRRRVSSESAYLTSNVLARPNLKVVIHAHVTRILFEKTDGKTCATGVEYAETANGTRYRSRAAKEVILSAGAIHSPHILMLSGVGPADHLEKHSIPLVHDLPGVGANLIDHPVVDVCFKDKYNNSFKFLTPRTAVDFFKFFAAIVQYKLGKGGPLVTNLGESAAFVRTDDPVLFPPAEYPEKLQDSTAGPGSPDLELFITLLAYKEHGLELFDVHSRALHCYLLRPLSQGSVCLKSADPFENPSVNPNYLQHPDDVKKLLRGVRLCLKIAQTGPLASHLDHDFKRPDLDHQLHLKTDEELTAIIKERIETVYHPTSTCRMAPPSENGVVDAKLRVYGIDGLRVCDASFFPWIVSGHTAGACFAAGEKLADDLKALYRA